MAQNQNQVAAERAAGAAPPGLAKERGGRKGRVVVLDALPLNALPKTHLRLDILPINIYDLLRWIYDRVAEGYISMQYLRNKAIAKAFFREGVLLLLPDSDSYQYMPDDIIVVVSPKSPVQEQTQVRIEDLEAWIVTVL